MGSRPPLHQCAYNRTSHLSSDLFSTQFLAPPMYRTLAPDKIIETLLTLEARIRERFGVIGLTRVCSELIEIARQTEQRAKQIARPNLWLRGGILALLAGGAVLLAYVGQRLWHSTKTSDDLYSTLQGIDAGFNIVVLMGAALYFLVSLEERMKRRAALRALHELRSIVHVIDMHQLTKDPSAEVLVSQATASSPKRALSGFELMRYLDYCSELLSLTAKVAVLYAQSFPDPIVTEVVTDIERTSSGLSQKIWQKINIVERGLERGTTLG